MVLKRISFLFVFLAVSCVQEDFVALPTPPISVPLGEAFYYEIDLTNRSEDTFKVRLFVEGLTDANNIFQFPATVPGTYSISDIGRFVVSFRAYDVRYKEIPTARVATNDNQWLITRPEDAYIIEYTVKETFDTPVDRDDIYPMAGTSLESDHALLNTFCVLGYPTGMKEKDFYLKIWAPKGWKVGTSLAVSEDSLYYAEDYDRLADSPLLLGRLSSSSTLVADTKVGVYTYSVTDQIHAADVLEDIHQVLDDAREFLDGLPVDRYNFLYFFQDRSAGALEHSYSSMYVLREQPYTESYGRFLKNISAHEFFHIVTPLNIHSEIIGDFNFAEPVASRHLWFYEGVTEWAAHMMQYRNGSKSLENLLDTFSGKIAGANDYGNALSLTDISLKSYQQEGGQYYGNVYQRGALVALLLDIKLLKLSQGEYGLRELLLELMETYGKDKSFSETEFFDVITAMTYPEVREFISLYIEGKEALPLHYLEAVGIDFNPADGSLTLRPSLEPYQLYFFERWSTNF
jgi:predicted metalloprotease with PDZ domain